MDFFPTYLPLSQGILFPPFVYFVRPIRSQSEMFLAEGATHVNN